LVQLTDKFKFPPFFFKSV